MSYLLTQKIAATEQLQRAAAVVEVCYHLHIGQTCGYQECKMLISSLQAACTNIKSWKHSDIWVHKQKETCNHNQPTFSTTRKPHPIQFKA